MVFGRTSQPQVYPLSTWQDFVQWKPGDAELFSAAVTLPADKKLPNRHRTILCHDMAGGYLQDRFIQGCDDAEAYTFYHWHYVDIFIYFSHHFITIPPPGWSNAAHIHGTHILGTIITEWDDDKDLCKSFLDSREVCEEAVDKLVQIAVAYGFDGWLINIENQIEAKNIEILEHFIRTLTEKMHQQKPNSCVLWYDSVIKTGELKWQNSLNDLNSSFFDACDGIFLNYTWKDADLNSSHERALSKHRPYDVYVGVDVFGRGCFGGGGFSTNLAVQEARKRDLSVAIFAPGWVYETQTKTKFTENENRFWSLLHSLCPLREKSCIEASTGDILMTTFCQGRGQRLYYHGQVISENPWSNLSAQSLQVSDTNIQFEEKRSEQNMDYCPEDSFLGGSSLRLGGSFAGLPLTFRMFKTNIEVSEKLEVLWAYKFPHTKQEFALKLSFSGSKEKTFDFILGSVDLPNYMENKGENNSTPGAHYIQANQEEKINGWQLRRAFCNPHQCPCKLREVVAEIVQKEPNDATCTVLLGMIQITTARSDPQETPLVSNLRCDNDTPLTLQKADQVSDVEASEFTHLKWNYPARFPKLFYIFIEYVNKDGCLQKKFVGQTRSCSFLLPKGALENLEPPVYVKVSPVTHYLWGREPGFSKLLVKDVPTGK